jgi:DNA/RNA-binding domain of Phe-tRNA-synthetase-like protein
MPLFQYDAAIARDFPQAVAGVLFASGMRVEAEPAALQAYYQTEQQAAIERIGEQALSSITSIAAWRGAFSKFGVDPTKTRSAVEALLRRLTKKGDIPTINPLVDIGNLVSIRHALPVAIFDTRTLHGALTVRYADGNEHFTELGSTEIIHPEVGEVIFADDSGVVYARRWCWRQSAGSSARTDTVNAIIVTEAQHANSIESVQQAVADLQELLQLYAGGTYQRGLIAGDHLVVMQ